MPEMYINNYTLMGYVTKVLLGFVIKYTYFAGTFPQFKNTFLFIRIIRRLYKEVDKLREFMEMQYYNTMKRKFDLQ